MISNQSEPDAERSAWIRIYENFHEIELLDDLYVVLNHVFLPPSTFFVDNKLIHNKKAAAALEKYIPGPIAVFIERHLSKLAEFLKIDTKASGGWEFWSRVSTINSPSFGYLHIDNDELLRVQSGELMTPVYGSILYVGPKHGMEGGETAFLTTSNARIDSYIFTSLLEHEYSTPPFTFIEPNTGRLVVFAGNLPHAVMRIRPETALPRVTFLANYWERRLSSVSDGVCSMTPMEYRGEDAINFS